ncbi:hypothetical protein GA0115259_106632 [Streptomyces sp. MnatMP-M17]|nr:hypothetical protein GA0115259_106632 [Streptomyces sp. MnatMP-M17]
MSSARQALHLHFPPAGGRLSLDHRRVTPRGEPELHHDHTGFPGLERTPAPGHSPAETAKPTEVPLPQGRVSQTPRHGAGAAPPGPGTIPGRGERSAPPSNVEGWWDPAYGRRGLRGTTPKVSRPMLSGPSKAEAATSSRAWPGWTGSGSVAGHAASSHRSGSSGPSVFLRISRPAGLTRRATNREYMRLAPLRPLPRRKPSRHCTGLAACFPAAMTRYFTVLADSG